MRQIEKVLARTANVTTALAVVFVMAFGLTSSVAQGASKPGYGAPVGKVGPCPAKSFDESTLPLIITLLRNGVPYAWYNISTDSGTDWYHFDVPAGRYQLVTTYTGTRSHWITVVAGKSPRTDLSMQCLTNHS
jgi:hypothetical protein